LQRSTFEAEDAADGRTSGTAEQAELRGGRWSSDRVIHNHPGE
jgi:hypothetical protein